MKMNFKIIYFIIGLVVILGLSGSLIFARTETDNFPISGKAKEKICEKIEEIFLKVDQKISERWTKIEEKRTEQREKLKEKREEQKRKIEEKRAKWDKNREELYLKLEEKAKNDSQKQALLNFKVVVDSAIKARREAVDAALQEFRNGIDNLIVSRKNKINEIANSYRNSLLLAVSKAKEDCLNGMNPALVRQTLREALQSARQKFIEEKQTTEKIGQSVQPLIDQRKEAIEKAFNDFKIVLEKAIDDLKAAFGENKTE